MDFLLISSKFLWWQWSYGDFRYGDPIKELDLYENSSGEAGKLALIAVESKLVLLSIIDENSI